MAQKKEPKGKKPKRQRNKVKKSTYYSTEGEGLKRVKKACPKCGSGVFLAEHKNRFSCGKCAYTEYKQGEKQGEEK